MFFVIFLFYFFLLFGEIIISLRLDKLGGLFLKLKTNASVSQLTPSIFVGITRK